ncbi:MAG: hypothetical protein WCA46_04245 [Actinocatenispora sp.]
MQSILPVVLFAAAGVLVGGAYSIRKQGGSRFAVVAVACLAVLALLGGIAWLLPKGFV